jgi:ATP-binding cassette subfamily F protein 3
VAKQPGPGQPRQRPTAASERRRRALEGQIRNEHYRAITPVRERIAEIEREMAANTGRIREIEAMMADPDHYKDSANVVAVNREYAELKGQVASLTAEWEGLADEAERIDADYRRRREELAA